MSRLSTLSASPTVTSFAQGAAQRAVQPVADFLAPPVEVSASTGKYKVYSEKHRFHIPDTRRSVGGRAVEIGFDASDATYDCTPHALDYPIDNLEKIESDSAGENMLKEAASIVSEIGALSHEKAVIDAALAAIGAGTDSNFTSGSIDPVDVLDDAILNVIKAAKYGSLMGVGVLFGATAFKRFKNNSNVRARYVVSAGTKGNSTLGQVAPSIEDVGGLLLSKPETKLSLMVYDSAQEGKTASNNFVLDTGILIFARMANPTRRDPSFMKTFRLMGQWMKPGIYQRDDGRVEVVKYDWSEDVKVTNSTAAVRINATAA